MGETMRMKDFVRKLERELKNKIVDRQDTIYAGPLSEDDVIQCVREVMRAKLKSGDR
jgi:hypothetical protein